MYRIIHNSKVTKTYQLIILSLVCSKISQSYNLVVTIYVNSILIPISHLPIYMTLITSSHEHNVILVIGAYVFI